MSVSREKHIERRLLAIIRRHPGRFRPNGLVREAGFRRLDSLTAIKRLSESGQISRRADGGLVAGGGSPRSASS